MFICKPKVVIISVLSIFLACSPTISRATEGNVMAVEGNTSSSVFPPPTPSTSTLAPDLLQIPPSTANVPQVPPDYVPSPQQSPPPAPIYVAPQPAQVILPAAPPPFVYVPELGYYVAMGLAFDIIYDGSAYYFHNGGYWYRTLYYGEPWIHIAPRLLPPAFVGFNLSEVHRHRDREFYRYQREKGQYRGHIHRPQARKGERREEHIKN